MRSAAWNVLLGVAAAFVVVAGLRAAASILIPLVVAGLLAVVIYPVVDWLRRRRVPTGVAVLGSILVALVVLAGPVVIVGRAATQFVARVPAYHDALSRLAARLSAWTEQQGLALQFPLADAGIVIDSIRFAATGTATLLTNLFLVLLVAAFALLEAAEFRPKLQAAFRISEDTSRKLAQATHHVHEFLWLKSLVSAGTGLAAWLWTTATGIEFALLWGLSAFLLNYIPNFGSLLAAVPPVLLALISGGWWHALVVGVGYVVINVTFGSVLEPRLIGRRLGLSPFALVVALVFWGWVWGAVGLLLAVPVTMATRLVLEEFDETRWIAVLIARAPKPLS